LFSHLPEKEISLIEKNKLCTLQFIYVRYNSTTSYGRERDLVPPVFINISSSGLSTHGDNNDFISSVLVKVYSINPEVVFKLRTLDMNSAECWFKFSTGYIYFDIFSCAQQYFLFVISIYITCCQKLHAAWQVYLQKWFSLLNCKKLVAELHFFYRGGINLCIRRGKTNTIRNPEESLGNNHIRFDRPGCKQKSNLGIKPFCFLDSFLRVIRLDACFKNIEPSRLFQASEIQVSNIPVNTF
jgi:hypothetical protein